MATKKSLNLMPHIAPVSSKILIQSRVSRTMFEEIQQRASLENRSLANFLENWLEGTFKDYPISGPFPGTTQMCPSCSAVGTHKPDCKKVSNG